MVHQSHAHRTTNDHPGVLFRKEGSNMSYEACLQELEWLKSIDARLKLLVTPESSGYRGNKGSWTYYKVRNSFFYEQIVTYTGATQNVDLDFPNASQLNRIEQIWSDATARDFSCVVYTDPSLSSVIQLDTQVTNTATSRLLQLGSEYKYPSGSRLRIIYANTTISKTVTIRIQVDEL